MKCPASEFSLEFVEMMQARMGMSFHKYGPVRDAYPEKVNALESLRKRLEKYEDTGNTEWLIDAANFCMIEFMLPAHPRAHFRATDATESPGRAAYDTGLEHTTLSNGQLTADEWHALQEHRKARRDAGQAEVREVQATHQADQGLRPGSRSVLVLHEGHSSAEAEEVKR